jgi:hypothetical protein
MALDFLDFLGSNVAGWWFEPTILKNMPSAVGKDDIPYKTWEKNV